MLHDLNTSEASFAGYSSVVDLFTQQARRSPDARALAYGATHLTYAELDARSNQLAHYLKQTYEVGAGDLVGILMDRSDQLLIAILGILKSGAAYVPVDVEYPRPRQEYIIQDAGIKVLITQSEVHVRRILFEGIVFAIDIQLSVTGASTEPLAIEWPAAARWLISSIPRGLLAYPKVDALLTATLSNYIQWANNYYFKQEPRPVFGLYTSLSFDLTVTSLFCPLTKGGSLHIYPQKTEFPAILAHSFDPESGINSIKLTPSHIHLIKGLQLPPGILKYAIVGGEEVTREHVSILKQVNPAMQVFNEYGPTETTVGCIVKELQEGEEVLIGRPIANTTVYILDDSLALCALGIPGEICIGGAGVGLGYLNKPELLGQKFIADPFALSGQLYRTGDRGRWMPDGELAFLGRKDEQVKIKGYRIEPGEIISALESHPDIKAATVTIRKEPDGQQALVAYMASDARLQAGSIRAWLSNSLPAYMIPAHYVRLDALPLTPNGKIDKAQLPDPEESSLRTGSVYMAPRNEKEAILVSVFEEVLRKSPVGIRDDFFVLGGDSIKSIQIVSRLKKKGYAAAIHDILVHPIIEDLADAIHPVTRFIDQQRVEGAITLSPIQRYFFQTHSEGYHHFNQSVLLSSRQPLIEEAIRAVMDKLLEHHDALRMVFHHNGTTWIQDNKAAATGKLGRSDRYTR